MSVAPQPTLMFVPSGSLPIACTSAPSCSNARGASSEYAPFAQSTAIRRPGEVGAEVRERRGRGSASAAPDGVLDRALRATGGASSSASISSSASSVSLRPRAVEELHAVVLGRVVRGGDDDAEVERGERDRRRRQHAAEHRGPAGRDDAARERRLELDPGAARVAPDEDAPGAAPKRRRAPEPLDEVGRDELADDPAHAVGPEVAATP